ncbi:hypothetical protein LOK74_16275 [Brevibacillus humidisoli]|uniref:hypothetical protein n=1 Tax=Brevibacillus humidisoli TaxID=2895522 RepID=UPI001E290D08|nr:hypothetical protein [Brevibacillus humidisoli]UFJ39602.1 hypothetical protein LOK74_16275 [Brevibacillus humidisoli]
MTYKIGVVGPGPSIERILGVAKEFRAEMEFIAYPYQNAQETKQIVAEHDPDVDGWLFTGQIPYLIARKALQTEEHLVYIPHTGSSLYKCFFHMAYYQKKFLERVSIDTVQSEDVEEALQELGIPTQEIYIKTYDDYIQPDELFRFHLQLWQEGKTEGAVTCFQATYLALQQEGIPAYWISPTKMVIRTTLKLILEKMKTSYFKDTQIGVEIIEVEHFDKIIEKAKTPYHLQYLELRLKEMLLKLGEKLDGSLLEKGNGRYVIFSSRGAIEREIPVLQDTVRQLSLEVDDPVAVGIGFGETVFAAETNARRAVQHAKEKEGRGIIIVQDDGQIVESVGQKEELAYAYRSEDKELHERLKQANISIKTYKKIEALVRRKGWDSFTTADLASYLSMTHRNARRIVASLCENQLVECIGEESHASRGRPSKVYRLT